MTSCAWLWMYIGAALMLLEVLASGFIIFFFGLSAATVGLLRFIFGDALSLAWQLAAFSFFSILYLAVLRRALKSVFGGVKTQSASDFDSEYVGRTGTITQACAPGRPGRVLIGDAEWNCECESAIEPGALVRVVRQSNLTLFVESSLAQ